MLSTSKRSERKTQTRDYVKQVYNEWKYEYSIGKIVLNVNLTAKVFGWS